ncbi:hypothetical protein MLD38_003590 [Melastoma candidum]|uniref:Uncharacterized protein n=1 Tax=Melastoma candidum TaxID=119954 RepID=A0ACB9SBK5_9MYRT|nr:hypothetical protein MLD38_003590 [Melastoma candidum]
MVMAVTWIRGKCLGTGSFATVHLAFHPTHSFFFAVKSVHTTSCLPAQLHSLDNEIHVLRSLPPSPYVVHYLGNDASTSCRNLYLEYLPGGSLVDVTRRRGGIFSEADQLVVRSQVRCVVNALRHIHSNGIVHCDVKGSNVLVGSGSDPAVAKLVDFGLAIRTEDLEKSKNVTRGSPLWMAPEVIRGEYIGPESDVWSLGCTLIEVVTGKPAWEDKGADTLRRIGYSSELPKFPSQLSETGSDFLEKCLRRDYGDRWSCDQLLQHPFLETGPSESVASTGAECSPRCVLDWPETEFEEEKGEEHRREEYKAAARGVIGKLSRSVEPSWGMEGEGWVEVRDMGEGAEIGLGCNDVEEDNENAGGGGGEAGGGGRVGTGIGTGSHRGI